MTINSQMFDRKGIVMVTGELSYSVDTRQITSGVELVTTVRSRMMTFR